MPAIVSLRHPPLDPLIGFMFSSVSGLESIVLGFKFQLLATSTVWARTVYNYIGLIENSANKHYFRKTLAMHKGALNEPQLLVNREIKSRDPT